MENEKHSQLFISLVYTFQMQTLVSLGKLKNPMTEKTEKDLTAAQTTIDMLEMLKEKTKNNLNEQESNFLDQSLSDLRLNYVEEQSRSEKKEEDSGDKKSESEKKEEDSGDKKSESEKKEEDSGDKKTESEKKEEDSGDKKTESEKKEEETDDKKTADEQKKEEKGDENKSGDNKEKN